jgi:hypothetical protein
MAEVKPLKAGATGIETFASTDTLPASALPGLSVEPSVNQTAEGPFTSSINAGATITVMDCVRVSSAGTWTLTDADAESTSGGLLGISLESKTIGQAMKVALPGSVIRNDSWAWATVGAPLYLSQTAGAITDTAPTGTDVVQRVIGFVLTDDCIFFHPSPDYIVLN